MDKETEIVEEIEEIIPEVKEEIKEEVKEEIKEEPKNDGIDRPTPGILDKIAGIFKRKEVEQPVEVVEEESVEEIKEEIEEVEPQYELIDPKFVDTAKAYGWSDKRIVEYAQKHSDIDVVTMTGLMGKSSQTPQKTEPEKGFYDEEALAKLAEEDETVKAFIEQFAKPLAMRLKDVSSELEGLKTGLQTQEESRKAQKDISNMEIANEVFDTAELKALGNTKEIPKYPDGSFDLTDSVVQERQKVWEIAKLFHAKGGSFKSAMDNAVRWYKGSGAEADMEKRVINKLKKQETKVFPQRTTQKVAKTYGSEEERKADVINTALAKYNVQLPE